jgi:hypothetical protein
MRVTHRSHRGKCQSTMYWLLQFIRRIQHRHRPTTMTAVRPLFSLPQCVGIRLCLLMCQRRISQRLQYPSRTCTLLFSDLVVRIFRWVVVLVSILARICHLVLQHFDELVEPNGENAAKTRSDPVYPVLGIVQALGCVRDSKSRRCSILQLALRRKAPIQFPQVQ